MHRMHGALRTLRMNYVAWTGLHVSYSNVKERAAVIIILWIMAIDNFKIRIPVGRNSVKCINIPH